MKHGLAKWLTKRPLHNAHQLWKITNAWRTGGGIEGSIATPIPGRVTVRTLQGSAVT